MPLPQKLYGIIGDPVAHSLSPLLHDAGFRALGIPAAFFPWRVPPSGLPAFVQAVRTLSIAGVCVTLPHKEAILPLPDRLSPLAAHVGAVNTLYWENGCLVGHNTDVEGFLSPLRSLPPFPTALILGAGGAARAAMAGLLALPGVKRVLVAARREEQAAALLDGVRLPPAPGKDGQTGGTPPPAREFLPWRERGQARADLVINATPLGLDDRESPMETFAGHGLAYDMIYRDTPFLDAARAAGWDTLNGREMFIRQASAQFVLWTGFPLPESAVAAAAQAMSPSSPPPSNP